MDRLIHHPHPPTAPPTEPTAHCAHPPPRARPSRSTPNQPHTPFIERVRRSTPNQPRTPFIDRVRLDLSPRTHVHGLSSTHWCKTLFLWSRLTRSIFKWLLLEISSHDFSRLTRSIFYNEILCHNFSRPVAACVRH
jgi:hypothetical protein